MATVLSVAAMQHSLTQVPTAGRHETGLQTAIQHTLLYSVCFILKVATFVSKAARAFILNGDNRGQKRIPLCHE